MNWNCQKCGKRITCKQYYQKIYAAIRCLIDIYLIEIAYTFLPPSILGKKPGIKKLYEIYAITPEELTMVCFYKVCSNLMLEHMPVFSYAQMLADAHPAEVLSSDNLGSNALYKSRSRVFAKICNIHNHPKDTFSNMTVDKFLIFEFLFKYRMNRKKQSDEISDEAVHDRIVSKDIIKMMYAYTLPKKKNYNIEQFGKDLECFDKIIYKDIEENSDSYFEKCLKYAFCEHLTHFETSYKVVDMLENEFKMLPQESKIVILFCAAALRKLKINMDDKNTKSNKDDEIESHKESDSTKECEEPQEPKSTDECEESYKSFKTPLVEFPVFPNNNYIKCFFDEIKGNVKEINKQQQSDKDSSENDEANGKILETETTENSLDEETPAKSSENAKAIEKDVLGIDFYPRNCAQALAHLSIICNCITCKMVDAVKSNIPFHVKECPTSENIFKNYLGMGQHIVRDKELKSKCILEDIMEIYSAADHIDERLAPAEYEKAFQNLINLEFKDIKLN